jgi:high-affinity iron transporter
MNRAARLPAALPLLAVLVMAPLARAAVTAEQQAAATRVLELLRGVVTEYAEAFDPDGSLARPIELEEASLLLAEARDLVPKLGIDAAMVTAIEKGVRDQAGEAAVETLVGALSTRVTEVTGIVLQQVPAEAPSAERGAVLFQENCAGCHGADGRGGGEEARRLGLVPADFTDAAFMRLETPDDFFNVIGLGRRRSGMPSWSDSLTVQQRWDLVRYVWTFIHPPALVAQGRALVADRCPACDSVADPATLARSSDGDLLAGLSSGPSAAQLAGVDEPGRVAVVAALRAGAFDRLFDPNAVEAPPRTARPVGEALAEVHALVDEVVAARKRGDAAGVGLATDAYMRFEPWEKRLAVADPGLVRRIEEGFVRLRHAARDPGSADDAGALAAALHRDLDTARAVLEPDAGAWVLFVQSAGIILREGFEVVLVVGALLAYVRRSRQPGMVRALHAGTAIGVVASVVTAVIIVTFLRVTPWAAEAIEGGAMLLAAVVLFFVSYWLVSKAEADRWQRYIRGKVESALSARSGMALGAAAFLAVYREGFETILFYQALFASAPAGDTMVPAGLVAGTLLLMVVYAGFQRVQSRVPMRAFFLGTGVFLYAMAIVFAGRGIAELQEAGLVSFTPVGWVPRVDVLGIFPTVESLAAQGVFVVLLLVAIAVTFARRSAAPAEERPSEKPSVAREATHG